MTDIKSEFQEQLKPSVSEYIAFSRAIAGKRYDRKFINRWFKKLVNLDEYSHEDISVILDHLVRMSNSEITK